MTFVGGMLAGLLLVLAVIVGGMLAAFVCVFKLVRDHHNRKLRR